MNPISFYNKKCLEIKSQNFHKHILDIFSNVKSSPPKQDNYFLLLTKYNNKKYTIFINCDKTQFVYIRFRFKQHLFKNTLFSGKLTNKPINTYYINDILLFKNEQLINNQEIKNKMIRTIIDNDYIYDSVMNVCKIYFNEKKITKIINKKDIKKDMNIGKKISNKNVREIQNKTNNKERIIKTMHKNKNGNEIDKKRNNTFVCYKTELPDVYKLEKDDKQYGNLLIQSINTSVKIKEMFNDNLKNNENNVEEERSIMLMCEYNERFRKWKPIL